MSHVYGVGLGLDMVVATPLSARRRSSAPAVAHIQGISRGWHVADWSTEERMLEAPRVIDQIESRVRELNTGAACAQTLPSPGLHSAAPLTPVARARG